MTFDGVNDTSAANVWAIDLPLRSWVKLFARVAGSPFTTRWGHWGWTAIFRDNIAFINREWNNVAVLHQVVVYLWSHHVVYVVTGRQLFVDGISVFHQTSNGWHIESTVDGVCGGTCFR
jgi:hypothetical protein